MRGLILGWVVSLAVVQAALPTQAAGSTLAAAAAVASLTVLVYRLGVWRQEMADLKHNVGAEVARARAESAEHFARLEQRFSAIDRFIEVATEQRVGMERWQSKIDTRLDAVDVGLARLERAGSSAIRRIGGDI